MVPSDIPTGSSLPSSRPSFFPSSSDGRIFGGTNDCSVVQLDFKCSGDGSRLVVGEFVKYEWRRHYGLIVTASSLLGGITPNDMPRVFDTENADEAGEFENLSILSPNRWCPGGVAGGGLGNGGLPGRPGANCKPKGLGLVIQSANTSIPGASDAVGVVNFDFDPPVEKVLSIGLLNVVSDTDFIMVSTVAGKEKIPIKGLGVNSAQDVKIDAVNVRSIAVHMHGPRVITHVTFCHVEDARQLSIMEPVSPLATPPSLHSDDGKFEPKAEQIRRIEIDRCKIDVTEGMIEIVNRSTSDVTFVVHPVLHRDCARQGLSWMAVDYPTPNLGLRCVSKMASSCEDDIVVTADCVDGVAVVDVYAFSHGLLGQIDGRAIMSPPACLVLSDDTLNPLEMCHYRFLLECSSVKMIERNKSASALRRGFQELSDKLP